MGQYPHESAMDRTSSPPLGSRIGAAGDSIDGGHGRRLFVVSPEAAPYTRRRTLTVAPSRRLLHQVHRLTEERPCHPKHLSPDRASRGWLRTDD